MMKSIFSLLKSKLENLFATWFFKSPDVMLIDATIQHILDCKSSVSRFGDGELMVILGHSIGFQNFDERLQKRLREILRNKEVSQLIVTVPDIFVEEKRALRTDENQKFWRKHLSQHRKEWYQYMDRSKIYYNTAISRFYYPIKDKRQSVLYADLLKKIWHNKELLIVEGEFSRMGVGNDLFKNATCLQRIICPAKNAFDIYDRILIETKKLGNGKLILIALGPTATVLAADLAAEGFWAIDIGHVDMEYMWMEQQTEVRTPIKGRILNEVSVEQDNALSFEEQENYLKSILIKIG